MARLPTNIDVFNAVAEPQRRDILDLLMGGELSVNEIAAALHIRQPQTSKHLKVLKDVQLVTVHRKGRQRIYRLRGEALQPLHDWVSTYAHTWSERYNRLDAYLQELQLQESDDDGDE